MQAKTDLTVVAEVQLTYKSKVKASDRPCISNADDSEKILRPLYGDSMEHRELFWVLYLNRRHQAIGAYLVGVGGIGGTVADQKLIFQGALLANASGIIISHNHPSGHPQPSQEDISLTKKIKAAGELLGITLLDHVILSEDRYYSFANEGIL